jgi:predicted enzyme related to lactoylglutathione lyase
MFVGMLGLRTIRILTTWVVLARASALLQASPLGLDGDPGCTLAGKFVWFDLATDDPAGARVFYGAVFGRRFREVDSQRGPYALIEHAAGKVGGMFRHARPQGAPVGSRWLSLISVRDAAKAADYVRQQGGQVIVAPTAVCRARPPKRHADEHEVWLRPATSADAACGRGGFAGPLCSRMCD